MGGCDATIASKADGSLTMASGGDLKIETVLLFPVMGKPGITGELFYLKMTDRPARREGQTMLDLRCDLMADHDRYLDALRAGDFNAVVAATAPTVRTVLRD